MEISLAIPNYIRKIYPFLLLQYNTFTPMSFFVVNVFIPEHEARDSEIQQEHRRSNWSIILCWYWRFVESHSQNAHFLVSTPWQELHVVISISSASITSTHFSRTIFIHSGFKSFFSKPFKIVTTNWVSFIQLSTSRRPCTELKKQFNDRVHWWLLSLPSNDYLLFSVGLHTESWQDWRH